MIYKINIESIVHCITVKNSTIIYMESEVSVRSTFDFVFLSTFG